MNKSTLTPRLQMLSYPLDLVTLNSAADRLQHWMNGSTPHTVITINPEIIVQADSDPNLAECIRKADLVTADGVGIVWAAKTLLKVKLPDRVTGVDLSTLLLERGSRHLRVFFLGGKPGVAERAAQRALAHYGSICVGAEHGYFKDDGVEDLALAQRIAAARPHLLLTALGAGRQEAFNERFRTVMNVPVAIGVGGTLDVLAGVVERAPSWTTRLGVEWMWRVFGDRKRWGRAPRLGMFVRKVLAAKRKP